MRIDVHFADRVGIAQEILAKLAKRELNVSAVEVEPPHVYIEAPALDAAGLDLLRSELLQVAGVLSVDELAMLPGARRRRAFPGWFVFGHTKAAREIRHVPFEREEAFRRALPLRSKAAA